MDGQGARRSRRRGLQGSCGCGEASGRGPRGEEIGHGLQGWCPPVPFLRRMGFRTASEIDYERYALKALRGDFKDVTANNGHDPVTIHKLLMSIRRN